MIRTGMALAALSAALVLAVRPAAAGVGARVTGGIAYVAYGDYNDFVGDVNARMAAETLAAGEIAEMHWVPSFGGEVLYSFAPALTAGLGAGVLRGSAAFDVVVGEESVAFEHTVTACPITGTLYAAIPMPLGSLKPYVFAGGGAYYAKLTFDESASSGAAYEAELSSWGFGVHGGAGFAIEIVPTVTAEIALSGRYAKLNGFSGTGTGSDGRAEDVFLAVAKGESAARYGPEPTALEGSYDEGSVDLSGFTLIVALRVRL